MTATLTEKAFLKMILELAQLCGWKTAHFRPLRTKKGEWRTAVQGDGKGFPDLVLIHPIREITLFVELKTNKGRCSVEQADWLNKLRLAGNHAWIWRPKMWLQIEATLKGD